MWSKMMQLEYRIKSLEARVRKQDEIIEALGNVVNKFVEVSRAAPIVIQTPVDGLDEDIMKHIRNINDRA